MHSDLEVRMATARRGVCVMQCMLTHIRQFSRPFLQCDYDDANGSAMDCCLGAKRC